MKDDTYDIAIYTSDLPGAATDATVSLEIYGSSGQTGELWLREERDSFQRGKVDRFTVVAPHVGMVEKIKVCHGKISCGSSWHLDRVEVYSHGTNSRQHFAANDWMGPSYKSEKLLSPSATNPQENTIKYKVVVTTSDIQGAVADVDAVMNLHGTNGQTGELVLKCRDGFQSGRAEEFTKDVKDIGQMTRMFLALGDKGHGIKWRVDYVKVIRVRDGKETFFDCQGQLIGPHGSFLEVPASSEDPTWGRCQYKLFVETADIKGGGTDARVCVIISGDGGQTRNHFLGGGDSPGLGQSSKTSFAFLDRDVGQIQQLYLGLNTPGRSFEWKCHSVVVENEHTGSTAVFRIDSWIDATDPGEWYDKSDGKVAPIESVAHHVKETLPACYDVIFNTSSQPGSDLDGEVSVLIHGKSASYGPEMFSSNNTLFKQGSTDAFVISSGDLGKIKQIELSIVSRADQASWLLLSVEIRNHQTGETSVFPCNKWLFSDAGTRYVLKPRKQELSKACSYKIEISTADPVVIDGFKVCIIGDEADTGRRKPERIGPVVSDSAPGTLMQFLLKGTTCVGAMQAIEFIYKREKQLNITEVRQIHVIDLSTGTQAFWIPERDPTIEHLDGSWCIVLPLSTKHQRALETPQKVSARAEYDLVGSHARIDTVSSTRQEWRNNGFPSGLTDERQLPVPLESGYEISFRTKRSFCSGARGQVSFDLVGDRGCSGRIQVQPAKRNAFTRGSVDTFSYPKLPYLGDLFQIRIHLDYQGLLGRGWELESVIVTHVASKTSWYCCYDDWIDKQVDFEVALPLFKQEIQQ
uniref:Lipoxygenase homology domain-containing protein 1 n=2 Tax=Tetraselmis sp. GSL018 TaxID=582737 RepID=A0A061QL18_9CHLO